MVTGASAGPWDGPVASTSRRGGSIITATSYFFFSPAMKAP